MRRINSFSLVPCIVLSIVIHSLVFFAIFYENSKKHVFIQVPFEVSFYSPVQTKVPESVEPKEVVKPVEEQKPVEEIKPVEEKPVVKKKKKKKAAKKDTIVVKNKEKEKKEEKPVEEKVVEEKPAEEKPQSAENSSSIISSNKGIMLENKNFKYSYYTNTIVKKIGKYWQWSSVTSTYRAVIYFKIARDGSVYDIKVKESSSDQNFDQNAIRAIELASPFAPLPSSYEDNYLGVYFEFKFH